MGTRIESTVILEQYYRTRSILCFIFSNHSWKPYSCATVLCSDISYMHVFPVSSTALSAAESAIQIHRRTKTLTTVPPLFAKPVMRMLDIEWVSNSGHSLGAHCRTTFPSSSSSPSAIFSSLGASSPSAPWMGHCVRILSGRKLPQCCLNARDIETFDTRR